MFGAVAAIASCAAGEAGFAAIGALSSSGLTAAVTTGFGAG